jgi:peptide deformylase
MTESFGIRKYGDRVLRGKGKIVEEFGRELKPLFEHMERTMIAARGVGLAAPQIGISKQIAIMNPEPEDDTKLIKMINPRIVAASKETAKIDEGCLSVPGVYQDESGKEHTLEAEGLLARIVQHELDHLNGVLFIDRLSLAKRSLIKAKLKNLAGGGKEK